MLSLRLNLCYLSVSVCHMCMYATCEYTTAANFQAGDACDWLANKVQQLPELTRSTVLEQQRARPRKIGRLECFLYCRRCCDRMPYRVFHMMAMAARSCVGTCPCVYRLRVPSGHSLPHMLPLTPRLPDAEIGNPTVGMVVRSSY